MITAFEIYLLGLVDKLLGLCLATFVISAIATFCCYIASHSAHDDDEEKLWLKRAKNFVVTAIVALLVATFTPSTKTLVTMTVLPEVVNNEKVQQLPDVFLDYIIEEFTVEKK